MSKGLPWFAAALQLSMFCASCAGAQSNGDAQNANMSAPGSPETSPYSSEPHVRSLVDPLNAACLATTGHELNAGGVCVCPDAGHIFFMTPNPAQGFCSRPVLGPTVDGTAATPLANAEGVYEVAAFGRYNSGGTFLDVHAPSQPDQARAVNDWVRSLMHRGDGGAPILWDPLQGYNELKVHVGRPRESPSMDALMLSTLRVQSQRNSYTTFSTYIVEPEVRWLDAVLGIVSLSPQERNALLLGDAPRGTDPRTVQDLLTAYNDIVGTDKRLRFASELPLFGQDCTRDCILLSSPLHVSPEAQVVVERIYSSGSLARESMWYRRDGELRAVVILGPNRIPGLIILLEPQITPFSVGGLVSFYDRQWTQLGTHHVPLPDNFSQLWDVKMRNTIRAEDEPALITCEPDMRGVIADSKLAASIAIGPHLPIFEGGTSLFGWVENASGFLDDYLLGYAARTLGFIKEPGLRDEEAAVHGRRVVLAARESSPRLRILPIGGFLSCFTNYWQWRSTVTKKVAVVNASFSASMQPQTCRPQVLPVLQESADTTLWVLGAGNEDGRPPLDTPKNRCPGSLSGEKNLLIVSGASHDDIHPLSVRGATYADIAAAWDIEEDGGTSFAAPRVAAVAAELAHAFTSLTPEAIRLTLMTSSRMTPGLHDSVRSGGLLDREAALTVGACVDESMASGISLSSGLLEMCMLQAGFRSRFIDDKMAMLHERGGFPTPQ